jgi:hypothetical protein
MIASGEIRDSLSGRPPKFALATADVSTQPKEQLLLPTPLISTMWLYGPVYSLMDNLGVSVPHPSRSQYAAEAFAEVYKLDTSANNPATDAMNAKRNLPILI